LVEQWQQEARYMTLEAENARGRQPAPANLSYHTAVARRAAYSRCADQLAAALAVAPSAPDAALRAPTGDCLAEEWHRDGRGLWAMRACINKAKHGGRIGGAHVFSAWRYNVQPLAVRPPVAAPLQEALKVECTCRVIEKCLRCEAIDAASVPASPPTREELLIKALRLTRTHDEHRWNCKIPNCRQCVDLAEDVAEARCEALGDVSNPPAPAGSPAPQEEK
jgi:hypothetical protein